MSQPWRLLGRVLRRRRTFRFRWDTMGRLAFCHWPGVEVGPILSASRQALLSGPWRGVRAPADRGSKVRRRSASTGCWLIIPSKASSIDSINCYFTYPYFSQKTVAYFLQYLLFLSSLNILPPLRQHSLPCQVGNFDLIWVHSNRLKIMSLLISLSNVKTYTLHIISR